MPVNSALSVNGQFAGYREGAWTPTVTTDGTAGTPTVTSVGSYEIIGRLVMLRFSITVTAWTGSPTGNLLITGFAGTTGTPTSTTNDRGMCHITTYATLAGLAASNIGLSGRISAGSGNIIVTQAGSTDTIALTQAQAGTSFNLFGWACYRLP